MTTCEADASSAKADLAAFCWFALGLRLAPWQEEMVDFLAQSPRIVLNAPPGHGKTTIVLVARAAWLLARDPSRKIMIACASFDQAVQRCLAVRSLVTSEAYQRMFPAVERGERWGTEAWDVAGEARTGPTPSCFAVAPGIKVAQGARPTDIICDDLISQQDAQSETVRRGVNEWIAGTLLTRIMPDVGGSFVSISTRWHQDDPTSRMRAMGFEYRNYPAPADEPLWPEMGFTREYLAEQRAMLGAALFNCAYLGDPSGMEGRLFRREWFDVVDSVPALTDIVEGWDFALTTKASSDWTVCTCLGRGEDGNLYLLDVWRVRREWPDVYASVSRRSLGGRAPRRVRAIGIPETTLELQTLQALRREPLDIPIIGTRSDTDKWSRANEWITDAEGRKIKLVKGAWNDEWLAEVSGFPDAHHDDQVDSFGVAWRLLSRKQRRILVG